MISPPSSCENKPNKAEIFFMQLGNIQVSTEKVSKGY